MDGYETKQRIVQVTEVLESPVCGDNGIILQIYP